jgi:hypothetical protein
MICWLDAAGILQVVEQILDIADGWHRKRYLQQFSEARLLYLRIGMNSTDVEKPAFRLFFRLWRALELKFYARTMVVQVGGCHAGMAEAIDALEPLSCVETLVVEGNLPRKAFHVLLRKTQNITLLYAPERCWSDSVPSGARHRRSVAPYFYRERQPEGEATTCSESGWNDTNTPLSEPELPTATWSNLKWVRTANNRIVNLRRCLIRYLEMDHSLCWGVGHVAVDEFSCLAETLQRVEVISVGWTEEYLRAWCRPTKESGSVDLDLQQAPHVYPLLTGVLIPWICLLKFVDVLRAARPDVVDVDIYWDFDDDKAKQLDELVPIAVRRVRVLAQGGTSEAKEEAWLKQRTAFCNWKLKKGGDPRMQIIEVDKIPATPVELPKILQDLGVKY